MYIVERNMWLLLLVSFIATGNNCSAKCPTLPNYAMRSSQDAPPPSCRTSFKGTRWLAHALKRFRLFAGSRAKRHGSRINFHGHRCRGFGGRTALRYNARVPRELRCRGSTSFVALVRSASRGKSLKMTSNRGHVCDSRHVSICRSEQKC